MNANEAVDVHIVRAAIDVGTCVFVSIEVYNLTEASCVGDVVPKGIPEGAVGTRELLERHWVLATSRKVPTYVHLILGSIVNHCHHVGLGLGVAHLVPDDVQGHWRGARW